MVGVGVESTTTGNERRGVGVSRVKVRRLNVKREVGTSEAFRTMESDLRDLSGEIWYEKELSNESFMYINEI